MAARLSPLAWRDVLASVAVALTVMCASGGLFFRVPWLMLGLLAGALAASVSGRMARAAAVAGAATAVGLLLGPSDPWAMDPAGTARFANAVLAGVTASATAAGLMIPDVRRVVTGKVLVWACVVLLVGGLAHTTLTLNAMPTLSAITGQPVPSFNDQLLGDIPAGAETSDNVLFFNIYRDVKAGVPFHESFRDRLLIWGDDPPRTILNYRMPYLFHFWASMPDARWIPSLYLTLVLGVSAALVSLMDGVVKRPFVVPAVAALSSFALYSTTSLLLFSMEPWAVMAALLSLAFAVASYSRPRWRAWVVASVAAAVVAVMARETIALIIVAGLASAVLSDAAQRRFRAIAWGTGLVAVLGAYAAHYALAAPFLEPSSELRQFVPGGVGFAVRGLVYATDYLGLGGPLPWVLAALGFLGAALVPGRGLKAYTLVATIAPLIAFATFANYAREHFTGEALNYWGAVLTPVLYACTAFAFLLLPGARAGGAGSGPVSRGDSSHPAGRGTPR